MTRIAATTCAVGFALAMTASAQQTTTTVQTTQAGDAKSISFTGCVGAGTETRTYVLDKVVPVTKTTEVVGTAGSSSTTTSYMLVPGEKVEIQAHVGHKVEVTGMLIPAESKTTTTTTRADPASPPSTTVVETKESPKAQFRVISIKDLAERCE